MFEDFRKQSLVTLSSPDLFYPIEGECHDQLEVLLHRRLIGQPTSDSLLLIAPCLPAGRQLLKTVIPEGVSILSLDGMVLSDAASALKFLSGEVPLANYESLECHLASTIKVPTCMVLDHFDAFCRHPQQELLAMLFEMTRSNTIPVVVVGLTANAQADQLLEKRVRSRFSQTRLFMAHERMEVGDTIIDALSQSGRSKAAFCWNKAIKTVIATLSPWMDSLLEVSLDHVATITTFLYRLISKSQSLDDLTDNVLAQAWEHALPSGGRLLEGLSDAALSLLLALRHANAGDEALSTVEALIRHHPEYCRLNVADGMTITRSSRVRLRMALEELCAHGILDVPVAAREQAELLWQPPRSTLNLIGIEMPAHVGDIIHRLI